MLPSLLLLGGAETVLRLAGFGYPTSFFKPATIRGNSCLVDNDRFGLRFFPPELARSPSPVVLRTQKPPGVYRVFLFGESAALGDPAPAFGVGRYLQALLRQRYPGQDFEVVCVAMTAINSHAILPIARECARLNGDLWVIYMGNNEMVGPFGAATVFGAKAPPAWLVRARLLVQQSRLHQVLTGWFARWRGKPNGRTWEGMKLFVESQIAPDNPARKVVHGNFRANLEDILRVGGQAGVPIVLSTVAVNLKDLAPFASLPGCATGTNLPPDFVRLMTEGEAAQTAGDWLAALRSYQAAARLEPRYADAQFRIAQCQLALSNRSAALTAFVQARDDDALPFRADSQLNAIIQEVGRVHAARGVRLYDAAAAMAAHSVEGIPGYESFYEHVHFHFDGNYRLARGLAGEIAWLLPAHITKRAVSDWASQAQCERELGLTDWNRREVLDNVLRRLTQPPFAGQNDNSKRIRHWQAQLNAVRQGISPTNAAAARSVYVEAIGRQPEDFRLHWNFAEFQEAIRDLPEATEEWRQVQALIPHHHIPPYQIGRLLAKQGRPTEARPWFDQAVALRPDLGAGWFELGNLSFLEGRYEAALEYFHRARQFVPRDSRIPYQAARALVRLKRSDEAMGQAREALRLDPDSWEVHSLLGEELAFAGQASEAQREFETTLRLKPDYAWAHLNLGVAHFKQGRREMALRQFEEALRLDPQLLLAKQYLERLKSPPSSAPDRNSSP